MAVVARPASPLRLRRALALGGLLGLGIWSLISTAWAESVENAVVSGNRWLAYGALLLLLLVLLRSERRSAMLLGAAGLGVVAVAISVLARLLGGDPGSLFLGGRLNSPLGYINGEGCLFVIGFWLCFAAAEARRALVAGPAAGMATLMACLAMLSQSRGTALAMLFALVAVVAVAPGRTRRIYGLLVVAGAVALAAPDLLRVYEHSAGGRCPWEPATSPVGPRCWPPSPRAWPGACSPLVWELAVSSRASGSRARTTGSWLLAIPIVVALALAGGSAQRIEHDVRTSGTPSRISPNQAPASTASAASQSRLLSGGGNRYDYWRIAWRVWRENPVLGVGAGNYPRSYYEQRATTEDIDQPHSVELQALSELGVVGALLLACLPRRDRLGDRAHASRGGALAAVARADGRRRRVPFVAWLAQTSVDWMHLLPGLTAIALAAAAVLVRLAKPSVGGGCRRGIPDSARRSRADRRLRWGHLPCW